MIVDDAYRIANFPLTIDEYCPETKLSRPEPINP